MLGVGQGLVDQFGDVVVEESVEHVAALALGDHKAEVSQVPELVGDRRLFHAHGLGELPHGMGPVLEAGEDSQAAGGGEGLQDACNRLSGVRVEVEPGGVPAALMSHRIILPIT
jgi:hypothetical protein